MSELKHYGILGQKWGVRRFQNKNGSLTAAGRKRYGAITVNQHDQAILYLVSHISANINF